MLFSPNEIVFGGNISVSYPLFKESFEQQLAQQGILLRSVEDTTQSIFIGMSQIIQSEKIN